MEALLGTVILGIGGAVTVLAGVIAYLFKQLIEVKAKEAQCQIRLAKLEEENEHHRDPQFHNEAQIVADAKGIIIGWNLPATMLLGWQHDEIVGKSIAVLVPSRFKRRHLEAYAKSIQGGLSPQHGPFEFYAKRKDGTEVPVTIYLSGHRLRDGTVYRNAYLSQRASSSENDLDDWNPDGSGEGKLPNGSNP